MAFEISKETSGEFYAGHRTVGTSAVQLTGLGFNLNRGVLLRAPGSNDPAPNTATVWVGPSGVTADANTESGGMPLPPGEALFIPIDDPRKLWLISTAASQDVAWMGM